MSWLDSISKIKGIGPKKVELFNKINIFTVKDLMFHFPFRFENLQVRQLNSILDQEKVTLAGTVVTQPVVSYFGKKNRLSFKLAVDDYNIIQVIFFNQAYLKNQIAIGKQCLVYGKWQSNNQSILGMKLLKSDGDANENCGVYPSVNGLSQHDIKKSIRLAFEKYSGQIIDIIPESINEKYRLMAMDQALFYLHFPPEEEAKKQAKRKIIYYEFFVFQWQLQNKLSLDLNVQEARIKFDNEHLKEVISQLPYQLTKAQKMAVNDICKDLLKLEPMKRLLQGDVGSGKTLVAFLAMIAAVTGGYQAVLMVPTEILARQHAENFNRLFNACNFQAVCLISNLKAKEKRQLIDEIERGQHQIIIGTHAVIQDDVLFDNLGLVIIDEQHRFGVQQRQALLNKTKFSPNLLQMTATPIPRSLALSIYGETAVSTIDELPNGRKPIVTQKVSPDEINQMYQKMHEELNKGHQIFYVLPLIENSDEINNVDNVIEIAQELRQIFPIIKIEVLHGQLAKKEQELVMEAFSKNECQILVATTMVEVGVDVPNATIIVIQSAQRFGLAQLHQLRGRVGRSDLPSYCFLVGEPTTEQGEARLNLMTQSQDGFYLSQEDLKIRGMGDLFGVNQSGLPKFKFANIIEDAKVFAIARQDVQLIQKQILPITDFERQLLENYQMQFEIMI